MSTSTRYSMRLRSRGANANDAAALGDTDNNDSVATATAAFRTALGNISNRECNSDAGDDEQQKPKRSKPSGVAERVKRSRSHSSKPTEGEPQPPEPQKRPAARRSSSRRAPAAVVKAASATGKKATSKRKSASRGEPALKKASAAKRAQPSKKDSKAKRGSDAERTSAGGEHGVRAQQCGRATKRARKSFEASAGVAVWPASGRHAQKSRSRSSSSAAVSRKKKSVRKRVDPVEVVPAPGDGRLVPADFGLRRGSFEGRSFTYGIAHYDAPDRSDPLQCKDYVTDMFQHLYQVETNARPKPYMDDQEDINEKMRAILVDWLVEVHMKFRLIPETLYLCVHIIDRYCATAHVQRTKLQLVGVTALFLACKHEEIYPPEVRDCVYITDRAYDRQEVLDMEQTILSVLDWKISLPTAYPFLDRFLCLTDASPMTRHAATYYLERTLQEHDLLEYRPSLVCASAVILALNNPDIRIHEDEYERDLPGLPNILMEYTEFDKNDLMSCMTIVSAKICEPAICASRRHLTAVRKKYEHRKYLSVSSVLEHPSVRFVEENMSLAD